MTKSSRKRGELGGFSRPKYAHIDECQLGEIGFQAWLSGFTNPKKDRNTMENVIEVSLSNGKVIPFRIADTKDMLHKYHAVTDPRNGRTHPAPNSRGVNVDEKFMNGLPTSATVLGKKVTLVKGKTTSSDNDKVSAAGVKVMVDGEERSFNIRISQTKTGFNVAGGITRPSGFGKGIAEL